MGKMRVELNYHLEDEPTDFTSIRDLQERRVYLWRDLRSVLEQDQPQALNRRVSHYDVEPGAAFMEIWEQTDSYENPPNTVNDMWTEQFKSRSGDSFTSEWHPSHKSLRLVWFQTEETLQSSKILASVQREIQRLSLDPPAFPVYRV